MRSSGSLTLKDKQAFLAAFKKDLQERIAEFLEGSTKRSQAIYAESAELRNDASDSGVLDQVLSLGEALNRRRQSLQRCEKDLQNFVVAMSEVGEGALILVRAYEEEEPGQFFYFISPCAGRKIEVEGDAVFVISSAAKELAGKKAGDLATVSGPNGKRTQFMILEVI